MQLISSADAILAPHSEEMGCAHGLLVEAVVADCSVAHCSTAKDITVHQKHCMVLGCAKRSNAASIDL